MSRSKEWPTVSLGDAIDLFDKLRVPLNSRQRAERQGAYPYYGASGVIDHIDDFIFDGRYLLIAEDGENLRSRKTPIAFFARGKFWVNNHAHIVRGRAGVTDDLFLKSWFDQADINGYITGAAQPKLSQDAVRRIQVRLPPLPTQQRIASILAAYEDLIENNVKRIEILETMARVLYREWFVNFRFPGNEKIKLIDSSLGQIPEGWKVVALGEVAAINAQSIKKGETPDFINYVDIKSVSTGKINNIEEIRFGDAPSRARRVVRDGDIIWSTVRPNRRSYARIQRPSPNMIVSTGFAVLSPSRLPSSYIYCFSTTDNFVSHLVNHARGAAYPAVTGKDFAEALVILPSKDVLGKFDDAATSFFEQSGILHMKNTVLRQIRDTLLPRLISGKINVDELDLPEAS